MITPDYELYVSLICLGCFGAGLFLGVLSGVKKRRTNSDIELMLSAHDCARKLNVEIALGNVEPRSQYHDLIIATERHQW